MTDRTSELRECPTPLDGREPLIAHLIAPTTCSERQGNHYHKCPSCSHAAGGPGASYVPSLPPIALPGVGPDPAPAAERIEPARSAVPKRSIPS